MEKVYKRVAQPYLFLWDLRWELEKWDKFKNFLDYRAD